MEQNQPQLKAFDIIYEVPISWNIKKMQELFDEESIQEIRRIPLPSFSRSSSSQSSLNFEETSKRTIYKNRERCCRDAFFNQIDLDCTISQLFHYHEEEVPFYLIKCLFHIQFYCHQTFSPCLFFQIVEEFMHNDCILLYVASRDKSNLQRGDDPIWSGFETVGHHLCDNFIDDVCKANRSVLALLGL